MRSRLFSIGAESFFFCLFFLVSIDDSESDFDPLWHLIVVSCMAYIERVLVSSVSVWNAGVSADDRERESVYVCVVTMMVAITIIEIDARRNY